MTSFHNARQAGEDQAVRTAAEVRAEMARKGLTKGDLAAALGVTLNTAKSRYEGSVPFNMVELTQVAIWLNVQMTQLLGKDAA